MESLEKNSWNVNGGEKNHSSDVQVQESSSSIGLIKFMKIKRIFFLGLCDAEEIRLVKSDDYEINYLFGSVNEANMESWNGTAAKSLEKYLVK